MVYLPHPQARGTGLSRKVRLIQKNQKPEIPPQTLQRAKVIVDQREGCITEVGDLIQPIQQGLFTAEHIHGELGEIVTERAVGGVTQEEITL